MDRALLATLKALSDASRLRIVGLLAARAYAVEELAAALDLSAGTVVHHLKRLRAAGLVDARASHPYMEYTLRLDALQRLGRQLDDLEHAGEDDAVTLPGPDGQALPAYDAKVLRAFLVDGRLSSIPAQEKKRHVVLRFLLDRCFVEDRDYPEKEVNQRLALYHADVASLRRYLIESGYLTRDGGVYRRAAEYPPPTIGSITP
ncbi:MAG TPA: metalloregulator ArsR/SmtB family transcription factor [Candidatus Limnocylindrales bacterium]|nr:metalloregulator ArsR/SmtB family transcription factor [Candidatus Limnocylindrales bacterium]